ncbi:uncharacterized protein MELLADRAFT_111168 [Melampsora larici-populina 98AG31]|uniref:Uncharacterized protein n=1 Tax=Melampsora larici-populina (strain 98AG31 / pathotype 3-4-7) TaxID=747676 RepID=F4S292_MELLP|nr:uncharacterized protein MELLADRAFT_111168 [Melampsora larici-populina 98AG31]EGG01135.1 hypothetical protein MELLADRAFT_111168 [Melampsora larici-populina 98AG31]
MPMRKALNLTEGKVIDLGQEFLNQISRPVGTNPAEKLINLGCRNQPMIYIDGNEKSFDEFCTLVSKHKFSNFEGQVCTMECIPRKKDHYKVFWNYVYDQDQLNEIYRDEAELHIFKEGKHYKIYYIRIDVFRQVPTIEIS